MMRNYRLSAFVSLAMIVSAGVALACEGEKGAALPKITVEELAAAMKSSTPPVVLDANNSDTRVKYGVIPGATLLSHYTNFNASTELPADRNQQLVFYCGGSKCRSAHKAAMKAQEMGYTHVSVLDVGIKGWVGAGQTVAPQS